MTHPTMLERAARGMSHELKSALDRVKGHVMSPEEIFEQRVSFVYGQQDWSGSAQRTKDEIRAHMVEIFGQPARTAIGDEG